MLYHFETIHVNEVCWYWIQRRECRYIQKNRCSCNNICSKEDNSYTKLLFSVS